MLEEEGSSLQKYAHLAEEIFFNGMKREKLEKIAEYREGKTFADVKTAVRQGRLNGLGEFEREMGTIAEELKKVIILKNY